MMQNTRENSLNNNEQIHCQKLTHISSKLQKLRPGHILYLHVLYTEYAYCLLQLNESGSDIGESGDYPIHRLKEIEGLFDKIKTAGANSGIEEAIREAMIKDIDRLCR